MVVSCNVCDRSGRMLLPAGCTLTERHFAILRMWGVLEAEVECDAEADGAPLPPGEDLPAEALAAARAEVEDHFRHNDPGHPAVKELMRICIVRRASSAA